MVSSSLYIPIQIHVIHVNKKYTSLEINYVRVLLSTISTQLV